MEVRVVSKQREISQQLMLEEPIRHRWFDRILLSLVSSFFIFQFGRLKGEKKLKYAEATSAEVYLDIDNILLGHIRPETLILD